MSQGLRSSDETFDYANLVDYYTHVDEPRHPEAICLLHHWQACVAQSGDFLIGRDIPARPIAKLLNSIVVYEPLPGDGDLRVRLAGDNTRRQFQVDLKGTLLSQQFTGKDFIHHLTASLEVIRTKRPIAIDSSLRRGNVEELHSEILLLPATAPDRRSGWLVVGMFFFV